MPDTTGQLTHCVFFALKDNSPENCQALVDQCHLHLMLPGGVVSMHVGCRVGDLDREVNDVDFDVSLVLVFESRQAHDAYQDHPEHLKFVQGNQENWSSVRVFDALV
jgi:hypothetical protein